MAYNANAQVQYVDGRGHFTLQGLALIGALVEALRTQEAQIAALDARVTALEP